MQASLTRRHLVFGAAASATLAAAYHGFRQLGNYPDAPIPSRVLTGKQAEIYRIVGDFVLPPGGGLPGSGGDPVTLARVDAFIVNLPLEKQLLISALPLAFEHGTLLDRYGARCLSALPEDRAQAYLTSWAQGTDAVTAPLWLAMKTVVSMGYFDRPDVLAAMKMTAACQVRS